VLRWLGRRLARRQEQLPRAWRVRRAVLIGRPFDAAHGEATESLKLKRPAIVAHFRAELNAAAELPAPSWMAVVPSGQSQHADTSLPPDGGAKAPRVSWAATTLWGSRQPDSKDLCGFVVAAGVAASPLREAVADVVERTGKAIATLREQGRL
jgi:hypothetical protein